MPTVAFNICCPRDCVSRHNGGAADAPLKPLRNDSALRALSSLRGLRGALKVGLHYATSLSDSRSSFVPSLDIPNDWTGLTGTFSSAAVREAPADEWKKKTPATRHSKSLKPLGTRLYEGFKGLLNSTLRRRLLLRLIFCTRGEIFSKFYQMKPKSDCIYHFSIDLEPNGRPVVSKSIEIIYRLIMHFKQVWFWDILF